MLWFWYVDHLTGFYTVLSFISILTVLSFNISAKPSVKHFACDYDLQFLSDSYVLGSTVGSETMARPIPTICNLLRARVLTYAPKPQPIRTIITTRKPCCSKNTLLRGKLDNLAQVAKAQCPKRNRTGKWYYASSNLYSQHEISL